VADPAIFEAHGLRQGEHLFIYLDGTELGDLEPDEILALLLERLADALSPATSCLDLPPLEPGGRLSYRDFRQAVLRVSGAGLRPIYLLDEFESLAGNPRLGPRFFSGLRALSSQFEISFVTASRQSLLKLTYANAETLSSPFFNTFANLHLGLYVASEARGLLETLASRAGLDLQPRMIERILELAGPHPLLLQMAAFHAVELRDQGDWEAEWRRRFVTEAGSHLEYYWRCLNDDERYTLAALPLTQGDEARRETLHALERACLIRREDQAWVYLCPPLEEFVRQQSVPRLLQLGPFLLDLSQQAALCDRAPLQVTRTEFKALAHLIRRAGQIVTPEELEKALWDDEYVEDPERVRAVIKSLRKALGARADCLVTRWGVGYIFQVFS
jgi:hypothetical protein